LSLDIGDLPGGFSLSLAADFSLDDEEIQKGQAAVAGFLETLEGDEHNTAREALETLTLVFSTGACDGVDFPWHQVRAHHGQAAINMLKEQGAPSKLESLRCELDPHRKFHQDPERYTPKKIQRFRNALRRVLKESRNLGFMSDDDWNRVKSPNKDLPQTGERIVSHGEFRALLAACQFDVSIDSARDRLIFYLLYHGGLKLAELMAVSVEDLNFDSKTQRVIVRTGKAKNQKSRRVGLPNEALISLEDWLQFRGNEEGALLNPVKKPSRVDPKRMTGPEVRAVCEKRAREVGVAIFTPDEMRKSPAAQIGQEKTERKKTTKGPGADESVAKLVVGNALYEPSGADEVVGQRKMAKVCFPVWELGLKS
jgi:integrase